LQIDLETFFRGFGGIESLRLRRTDTGLFKGSVLVQFVSQSDADKFLSEPQEWNGSLLDAKTKNAWIEEKKAEDEKLTWDERRERDKKREQEGRSQKHFSAFKEMQKSKEQGKKDRRKGKKEGKSQARSRSPVAKETVPAPTDSDAVEEKQSQSTARVEEAPSLFSIKGES
jgi:RNA recognition motif. (a.k.a. RRM, RBD, or RNP domain)